MSGEALIPEILPSRSRSTPTSRTLQPATIDVEAETSIEIVETRQRWANTIKSTLGRSMDAIIEAGDMLEQAKLELPHGQFEKMLAEDLRMSPATSRKLRAIAGSALLRSRANDLPGSWETVYQLTTLPGPDLELAFERGLVTPKLQRSEIPKLKVRLHIEKTGRAPKRPRPERPAAQRTTSDWEFVKDWMGETRMQAYQAADRRVQAEFLREVGALADKFFALENGKVPEVKP